MKTGLEEKAESVSAPQSYRADVATPDADADGLERLEQLARRVRYYILTCSTRAGSGHPTSSLSAVELMTALMFGGVFRFNLPDPLLANNDRLIFSKGHASPLYYAMWAVAGQISEEELDNYRQFGSPLEGHPTPAFPLVEAATGSLGQGLSIGVGFALNARKLDQLPYRTYVLLGDSEMAEGSQWEALEIAAHYQLDNLVGILDVNRLGQRGETMFGHDLKAYQARIAAFGWETILVDGHDLSAVLNAYRRVGAAPGKPLMIIARTLKGKGVSFLEDREGWHGRPLKPDELEKALRELGSIDHSVKGRIASPVLRNPQPLAVSEVKELQLSEGREPIATRAAYGSALRRLYPRYPNLVSLDGEVSNSTGADTFKEAFPGRFFEMYIAEQNMVGVAVGLSRRGKIPFVSTFAAFLTRAFDQIRMAQYSNANIKLIGSHAGVSIGEDGPSQMGLEDIAMFRTLLDAVVLQPADAVSTDRLVEAAIRHVGIVYLRTMRQKTPILYSLEEEFRIGGSKILRETDKDVATLVATGATVHEALKAHECLLKENIHTRVIDAYSLKPIDFSTLRRSAAATRFVVTCEDHYSEGGLGEAVLGALATTPVPIHVLAVRQKPRSGKPDELLEFEGISAKAIGAKVRDQVRLLR